MYNIFWSIYASLMYKFKGPYALSSVIEKMPYGLAAEYLAKYGASVGRNVRIERGINIHRPLGSRPFENLTIGDNVYIGHKTLIDLTEKVHISNGVIIASYCQLWTHYSDFEGNEASNYKYFEFKKPIWLGEAALLYSGVIISAGVSIGPFAKVAANSVVTKNIDSNTLNGGSPSRPLR